MEKSKMMLEFEQETGKQSAILKFITGGQALEQKSYPKLGPYDYNMDYIAWLEAKAEAYDRVMPKEGCEYCNPSFIGKHEAKMMLEESLEYLDDDGINDFNLSIYVSPNSPNIVVREDEDMLSFSKMVPIKYCPMCGRELEVR